MNLVIDRSVWLTGTALKIIGDGMFYEPTSGLMCVTGQYLHALGVKKEVLAHKAGPQGLFDDLPDEASWMLASRGIESGALRDILEVNDTTGPLLSPKEREFELTELFAKQGVTLTFTGSYAKATEAARAATSRALKVAKDIVTAMDVSLGPAPSFPKHKA